MDKLHLVVDDNSSNRIIMRKFLKKAGVKRIVTVESGKEAIDKYNKRVKVIWMDINMPGMEGRECARILRQDLNYSDFIIGISGLNITEDPNIDLIVPKPLDYDVIHHIVHDYINGKELQGLDDIVPKMDFYIVGSLKGKKPKISKHSTRRINKIGVEDEIEEIKEHVSSIKNTIINISCSDCIFSCSKILNRCLKVRVKTGDNKVSAV